MSTDTPTERGPGFTVGVSVDMEDLLDLGVEVARDAEGQGERRVVLLGLDRVDGRARARERGAEGCLGQAGRLPQRAHVVLHRGSSVQRMCQVCLTPDYMSSDLDNVRCMH